MTITCKVALSRSWPMIRPRPTDIELHTRSRVLEVVFDDGARFKLPCEYLRVYSPSAEVQGHGSHQQVLQIGKEAVNITDIEPVGNYAVRLRFDDGHSTGIFDWNYLYELGTEQDEKWRDYLARLQAAGYRRAD
jgi:DUF971 family protein